MPAPRTSRSRANAISAAHPSLSMRTHARLARTLALAASLGACTTWGRQPVPTPGEDRFFATARVTPAQGPAILLDNVTVGRDSVVGRERAGPRARVAIPVSGVRTVEA